MRVTYWDLGGLKLAAVLTIHSLGTTREGGSKGHGSIAGTWKGILGGKDNMTPGSPFSLRSCPSAPQLLAQALPLPLLSPPRFPVCSPLSSWSPLLPLHPQVQPLLVLAVFRNTSWSLFPQQGKAKEALLLILLQFPLHLLHHPHLGAVPSVGGSRKLGTAPLQLQGLQRLMAPSPLDLALPRLLCDMPHVLTSFLSCADSYTHKQRVREEGGRRFPQ